MKKRLVPILITVLTALVTAVCCIRSVSDRDPVADSMHFTVPCGRIPARMDPWKAEDGSYYIFLPSCSSLSGMKPVLSGHSEILLDGVSLTESTDLSSLKTGVSYDLTVRRLRNETHAKLLILQSSGVPAIFISTESGSMRKIDADKTYEEDAAVLFLDPSGKVLYAGSGKDSIHGRGNTTWSLDKKPYHLTLDSPQDLLGTGSSRHWILLANALDRTNLRNRIVHDCAGFAGLQWTPSCDYVDVYLNGGYNGLYLLTEQIETGSGRLEIDPVAGGFLFEITNKSSDEDLSFSTKAHRTVRLHEPKTCSDAQSRYPDQIFAIGKFYYRLLYNTPVFREKVIGLYRDAFLPAFTDYLRRDLPALKERIRAAEAMNNVRWPEKAGVASQTADGLEQFFRDRSGYLQEVWIEGIPCCSVWLCDADKTVVNHLSLPVSGGTVSLPAPDALGIGPSSVWYVRGTDRAFSAADAESGEVYLCPVSETEYQKQPQNYADFGDEEQQDIGVLDYVKRVLRHEWQIVVPLACFLILLAVLVLYFIHESYPPKSGGKRL